MCGTPTHPNSSISRSTVILVRFLVICEHSIDAVNKIRVVFNWLRVFVSIAFNNIISSGLLRFLCQGEFTQHPTYFHDRDNKLYVHLQRTSE